MPIQEGQQAADFTLSFENSGEFRLAALAADQLAVLAFFKASCPTCQFAFPYLERVYRNSNSNNRILFAGISQDNARETAEFRRDFPFTFPVLIDPEPYTVSSRYAVDFVPTIYLIAPGGTVQQTIEGFSKHGLQELAGHLARHAGMPPPEVFRPDEGVPVYRPG